LSVPHEEKPFGLPGDPPHRLQKFGLAVLSVMEYLEPGCFVSVMPPGGLFVGVIGQTAQEVEYFDAVYLPSVLPSGILLQQTVSSASPFQGRNDIFPQAFGQSVA